VLLPEKENKQETVSTNRR